MMIFSYLKATDLKQNIVPSILLTKKVCEKGEDF
jgi:hypothetical protein